MGQIGQPPEGEPICPPGVEPGIMRLSLCGAVPRADEIPFQVQPNLFNSAYGLAIYTL